MTSVLFARVRLGVDAADDILTSVPDVLLLDSEQFLASEADWPIRERDGKGPIKILSVAMSEDEDLFIDVVRHGVYGYVPKEVSAPDANLQEAANLVRSEHWTEQVLADRDGPVLTCDKI